MSSYHYQRSGDSTRSWKARPKIMGVCAGIAEQFEFDVAIVRICALVGLVFFTAPTVFAYLIAGMLFY